MRQFGQRRENWNAPYGGQHLGRPQEASGGGLGRFVCAAWALIVGCGALYATSRSAWLPGLFLGLHAFTVWPGVIARAHAHGMHKLRVLGAWGGLIGGVFAMFSAGGETMDRTPPAATAPPEHAAPRSQPPIEASSSATTPSSMAAQAAADDVKLARLIMIGRRTMTSVLRDPASASYRNVRLVGMPGTSGAIFCGEVNARNGFGGYAGYRRFIVVPGVQGWTEDMDGFAATWADICRSSRVVKTVPAF